MPTALVWRGFPGVPFLSYCTRSGLRLHITPAEVFLYITSYLIARAADCDSFLNVINPVAKVSSYLIARAADCDTVENSKPLSETYSFLSNCTRSGLRLGTTLS